MGVFSLDGRLFRGLMKAGDFVLLALMTMLFCIPIITVGPALTAAFYAGVKLIRDEESYVWKDFTKSFFGNIKQAFVLEIIHAAIGLFLYVDFRASNIWAKQLGDKLGQIYMFIILGLGIIWLATLFYTFALLSKFDNTIKGTLKNALIISTHHLPQTIVMFFISGALAWFSFVYLTAILVTTPIFLYVNCYIFSSIFKQLEKSQEEKEQETEGETETEETETEEEIEKEDEE